MKEKKKEKNKVKNKKKKGNVWFVGGFILIFLAVFMIFWIFLGTTGKIPGVLGSLEKSHSYQTKNSKNYQKEMEKLAVAESWRIEADEYGILQLTAQVKIPDYSQAFEDNLAEALKNSDDEAEFDEELFRLASEAKEELPFVTHEIQMNLSLLDEKKAKEDWTEREITKLLAGEAFHREMQDFAMKLTELYLSSGEGQEETVETEKEAEYE